MGSKHLEDLEWMKTAARNRKHGRSTVLGKEESREGLYRRGRGRSFHVDGLKIEKAWKPTLEKNKRKEGALLATTPTITLALQLHQHHFNWPQSAFMFRNNDGYFYGTLYHTLSLIHI